MTLSLRRPQPAEAEAMARLHIACWRESYAGIVPAAALDAADPGERTARWQRSLADPDGFALAAFDGEEPAGFILARANGDPAIPGADGQVAALYVLKSHHRRGLGRNLLGAAARWWLARGGRSLGLGVLAANVDARRFYEAMGGRVAKTGTYNWGGHQLPDAIYVFDDLARLGDSL